MKKERSSTLCPAKRTIFHSKTKKWCYLDDIWGISESGFVAWCTQLARDNVVALWRAFLETGYDFRLDRAWISDSVELTHIMTNGEWTKERDGTLVAYVDQLAETLRVTPASIHPHEIYLEESAFINPELNSLKGSIHDFCHCGYIFYR
jgi:hypothetical protein